MSEPLEAIEQVRDALRAKAQGKIVYNNEDGERIVRAADLAATLDAALVELRMERLGDEHVAAAWEAKDYQVIRLQAEKDRRIAELEERATEHVWHPDYDEEQGRVIEHCFHCNAPRECHYPGKKP